MYALPQRAAQDESTSASKVDPSDEHLERTAHGAKRGRQQAPALYSNVAGVEARCSPMTRPLGLLDLAHRVGDDPVASKQLGSCCTMICDCDP